MFYFLFQTFMTYNLILIAAAVIPAVFLMVRVWRADRLEKESPQLMWLLVKGGIFSALLALVEERIGSWILDAAVAKETVLYNVLLYFVVVAVAEESSKYIFLKRNSWNSPEFTSQYDGVIYAVFTSLGFALWENISYVMHFGFTTALVRAVTAIPGHACFGVFMGVFYGFARKYENYGKPAASRACRFLSLLIPMLLHGTYDYIATTQQTSGGWYFLAFVAVLFIVSYILVGKVSRQDKHIV
ncbi:MAG: PrsW family intramembrane metalloprotease [Clostridia bacterium]|nr:PrsW family intramembrane metalloprotease [Clostridia bacterium]